MSLIYLFFLLSVLASSGCIAEKGSSPRQVVNDSLLAIVSGEPEVASVIGEKPAYVVTILNPENISQLSKKYPVIYGNLPNKTLYRIDFKNETGMLVIVDMENKKVLKYFRTGGVSLG